ncbi:MAG: flagellar biosynthetic protein FliO [Ignavibacteriae bacterium]|nr:flagellar biosynthetic protein FliO [Ignavibacteriota bacterium]
MSTWDVVKIFLILGAMMGIMYALLYMVKKYFYSFEKKGEESTNVQVLSTQVILPKKFVSVIRFNNATYLLGVSEQSVNLIDKIDFLNETENIEITNEERPNFLSLLKKNMGFK